MARRAEDWWNWITGNDKPTYKSDPITQTSQEPWADSKPPEEARKKVPSDWGEGSPTKKAAKDPTKPGWRWQDPKNPGNGIRIDKGNPNHELPSQQVDHVVVRRNGRIIGPDGKPLEGPKPSDDPRAHIPVSDWLKWGNWAHP